MTDIAPLYKGAATETPKLEAQVQQEPHLPQVKDAPVEPSLPAPLATAKETGRPAPDEAATRLHAAKSRADITGLGGLVDVIV